MDLQPEVEYDEETKRFMLDETQSKRESVHSQLKMAKSMKKSSKKSFCRYCGAKNKADAIFCESCGKRITEEA